MSRHQTIRMVDMVLDAQASCWLLISSLPLSSIHFLPFSIFIDGVKVCVCLHLLLMLYSHIFPTVFQDSDSAVFSTELSFVFPVECKYSLLCHEGPLGPFRPLFSFNLVIAVICNFLFLYVVIISLRAEHHFFFLNFSNYLA